MTFLCRAAIVLSLGLASPCAFASMAGKPAQAPVPGLTRAPQISKSAAFQVQTLVSGLNHPWGLQFLPDGRLIVTERYGGIRIVAQDGTLSAELAGLPKVHMEDQGGLFDIALAPDFAKTGHLVFSYFEPRTKGEGLTVARATLRDMQLQDVQVIFRAEPVAGPAKNIGGRLLFGRDGTLFVSVGDRFSARDQAQDLASDLGKIIRIKIDGSIPQDNPFVGRPGARPEIWSYGHRNAQGLALHPQTGALWDNEHGARGGDEINLVESGQNYGWPVISYGVHYSGEKIGIGTAKDGMVQPLYYWDPSIAPSGLSFYTGDLFPAWKGSLFSGALRWKRLIRLTLEGTKVTGEEELLGNLGLRIRAVRQGPEGALYLLTDEQNGAILKLVP